MCERKPYTGKQQVHVPLPDICLAPTHTHPLFTHKSHHLQGINVGIKDLVSETSPVTAQSVPTLIPFASYHTKKEDSVPC